MHVSVNGFQRIGHKIARGVPAGNKTSEKIPRLVIRAPDGAAPTVDREPLQRPRPETIAAQAGGVVDAATGAVVPPIHVATTFVRDADNQYRRGYCYGRSDNATVRQVEDVLTDLELGKATLMFASGMAAAAAAFL